MTIVVDSSAVVAALVDEGPVGAWARGGLRSDVLAAPAHMYTEVSNVLRRAVLARRLGRDAAARPVGGRYGARLALRREPQPSVLARAGYRCTHRASRAEGLARIQARLWPMTSIPLSEAKDKLSSLVEAAETTHEIVTITRHGREAAVLMAKADLDSLHETLFWLSQPDVRTDVDDARAEQREGRTVSGDDLRAEFGLAE